MKKLILGIILAGAFNLAQATDYTYTFNQTGLNDMPGGNVYYEWGLSWGLPAGQTIVDATLTYSDIKLISGNATDYLYSSLLNSAPKGLTTYNDPQLDTPSPTGAGVLLLGTATFKGVGSSYNSLSYDFANITGALAALNTDVADGEFGIGIDPDCHYTDNGICLTITTTDNGKPHTTVPDAASTAMLLGLAFVGLGIFRRK